MRPEVEVIYDAETEARGVGSGFALGYGLVLTADHVVAGATSVGIRLYDSEGGLYKCQIVATDEDCQIALLKVVDQSWDDSKLDKVRFGEVEGDLPLACSIVGFTRAGPSLDSTQIFGQIPPLASRRAGQLTVRVDSAPSSLSGDVWAGISGAPLRAEGVIVGVVTSGIGNDILYAIRISKCLESPSIAPTLRQAGFNAPMYEKIGRLERIGGTVDDVINRVASADASNIQQVAALQIALNKKYYEGVLSQARASFIAALVGALVGLTLFLVAVAFIVVSGSIDAAIITTVSGAIVEVIAGLNFWLYSQTSKQLDAFHIRLDRVQRSLVGNSLATGIDDSGARNGAIEGVIAAVCRDEAKQAQ